LKAVDLMFSGLNISNLKALDVGFGLGGVAFYLAKTYKMHIVGVEIHPWMVSHANTVQPALLKKHLQFMTYSDDGTIPCAPRSFDLIYSKGVLNHVQDKITLFRQLGGLLKEKAPIIILDWLHQTQYQADSLTQETKQSYTLALREAGFNSLEFKDESKAFTIYVQEFIQNLYCVRHFIETQFGEDIFLAILEQHQTLLKEIVSAQKLPTRIHAKAVQKIKSLL
jgi:ubiquinone/menaquinone biosynthesis C-methylase UbiE